MAFDFSANGVAKVIMKNSESVAWINESVAWINRDGQVVVKQASVCGAGVLLNANGDIVWPRATATQICEEQAAKQR
jgi:hypothetical protein